MNITLTDQQQSSLAALVSGGSFASIEEAARALLDERLAEVGLEDDDVERTRALIAEAEVDVQRGAVLSFQEHRARVEALLTSFG